LVNRARDKNYHHGTPYLTDNELAMVAWQLGLVKFRNKAGVELTEQEAVCVNLFESKCNFYIVLRNPTPSNNTDPLPFGPR